jgi:lactoylglutathione lyase
VKFLHTSITVKDIEESLKFYTEVMGMEFERRRKIPENKAEIAFVHDPESGARIELTYWEGKASFDPGEQLDHMAFEVQDLDAFLQRARDHSVRIAKEPYQLKGGQSRLAFVLDPNDVWIELVEHPLPPR